MTPDYYGSLEDYIPDEMIKPNELRIGNLLYDDDSLLSCINGFKPFDHSVRCDEEEGCVLLIDIFKDSFIDRGYEVESTLCKPIPLTEEWLLKFGFERNRSLIIDSYSTEIKGKRLLSVTVQPGNQYIYVKDQDDLACIRNSDYHGIFYVHQLQNLYFALTGEELRVTNT